MNAPDFAALEPCPECGNDAEHATAPGPGEPINEYDCVSCGHQFTLGAPVLAVEP